MRIAHLPFAWYPDAVGGTEIYVRTLARLQRERGHEPVIIAPGNRNEQYDHDGMRVYRYAVQNDVADLAELYSARTSVDVAAFEAILRETAPAVLHVHGYGRAVSRDTIEAARRRGVRVVFTYHTPTATCMRGTLMRWGELPCEGILDAQLCAACLAHARGVPRPLAGWAARLKLTPLVRLRHAEIREFLEVVDHIIAPAEWVVQLLGRLGIARERITLNRQGTFESAPVTQSRHDGALRLAFFGRYDRTKGLDVLLDALRMVNVPVELHVYGIAQASDAYSRKLAARLRADRRVAVHDAVPHDALLETMRRHDVLAVPSQWFETGPLVVLEAFAAGVPVLGSHRGGIAEIVHDGVDGMLVEAGDRRAWARAIERLATDAALLDRLRAGVRAPRSMRTVAAEMDVVYHSLLQAA